MRVFKERRETFITGLRFMAAGVDTDKICGVVDMHDNGDIEQIAIGEGY